MARMIAIPGENGFTGVNETTAPMLQPAGSLTQANNMVIRNRSEIKSRNGVSVFIESPARPFNNDSGSSFQDAHPVTVPAGMWVDADGETHAFTVGGVGATPYWFLSNTRNAFRGNDFTMPKSQSAYLRDNVLGGNVIADQVLFVENYWGYKALKADGLTIDSNTYSAEWMEPRVVGGVYTTPRGPARLLDADQLVRNYEYISSFGASTGNPARVNSLPLAVPANPYMEATISYIDVNAVNTPGVVGDFYANSKKISSWAYSSVAVRDGKMSEPTPAEVVVTSTLPTPTKVELAVSNTRLKFTFAVDHKFTTGQAVEIVSCSDATWVGKGSFTTNGNSKEILFGLTNDTATHSAATVTVTEYRMPVACTIKIWPAKEITYDPNQASAPTIERKRLNNCFTPDTYRTTRVYRTKIATSDSLAVGAVDPGAEFFELPNIYDRSTVANSAEIDANFVITVKDTALDYDLAGFLYTNPSQKTASQPNSPPPIARSTEIFNGYTFWSGIQDRATVILDCKKANVNNISFTVVDPTLSFTSKTVTPSFSSTIPGDAREETARSIVRAINNDKNSPFVANYISGFAGEPGSIAVTTLCYRALDITVSTANIDNNYSVNGKRVSDNAYLIPAEKVSNRLRWSKLQQPHATPASNYLDLDAGVNILGIRTTSGRLNIITDAGIWELTGQTDTAWNLRSMDTTAKCVNAGAIQVVDDQLIVMTTQGLRSYGEQEVISYNVENRIFDAVAVAPAANEWITSRGAITSAVDAGNSEYLLFLPDRKGIYNCLRFNTRSACWTVTDRNFVSGAFHTKTRRMMFALGDGSVVMERDINDVWNNSDEVYSITSATQNALLQDGTWECRGNLIASTWDIVVQGAVRVDANRTVQDGDWVFVQQTRTTTNAQGDILKTETLGGNIIQIHTVEAVANSTQQLYKTSQPIPAPGRVSGVNQYVDTALWLVKPIRNHIELAPISGNNASTRKKFSELQVHTVGNNTSALAIATSTDEQRITRNSTVGNAHFTYGWNTREWGSAPWADPTNNANPVLRTWISQPHNSARSLTIGISNTGFNETLRVQTVTVVTDEKSTRTAR